MCRLLYLLYKNKQSLGVVRHTFFGRTPHETVKNQRYTDEVARFAETSWARVHGDRDDADKLGTPWGRPVEASQKSEVGDALLCGCSKGATRHRTVRDLISSWMIFGELHGNSNVDPKDQLWVTSRLVRNSEPSQTERMVGEVKLHECVFQAAATHERRRSESQVCGATHRVRRPRPCVPTTRHMRARCCRGTTENRYVGLFNSRTALVHSPTTTLFVPIPPAGPVLLGQGVLLRSTLHATRKAPTLWARTYSKGLQGDGWSQSGVFPETLCHAGLVATTTCPGADFMVEVPSEGLGIIGLGMDHE